MRERAPGDLGQGYVDPWLLRGLRDARVLVERALPAGSTVLEGAGT